jgi:hypothetical protein
MNLGINNHRNLKKNGNLIFAPLVCKNTISFGVLNLKLDVSWAGCVIFWRAVFGFQEICILKLYR